MSLFLAMNQVETMYNHHKGEYFGTLDVQQTPWSTDYSNESVRTNQGGNATWLCIVHCQYYRELLCFFAISLLQLSGKEWLWDAQLQCHQRLFQRNLNKRGTEGIRATNFAVERNKYYIFRVCVCSLSHPACKAHAPYYHLSMSGSTVCSHIVS